MSVNIYHGGIGGYRVGSPYYPTPDISLTDVYQIKRDNSCVKRLVSFELRGEDEELRRYVREAFAESPNGLNENFRILFLPKATRLTGFSYRVLDGETGVSGSFALEVNGVQTELIAATSMATSQTHDTWSSAVDAGSPIILTHNSFIVWTPTALPTGGLPALKKLRFEVRTYGDNPNEAY